MKSLLVLSISFLILFGEIGMLYGHCGHCGKDEYIFAHAGKCKRIEKKIEEVKYPVVLEKGVKFIYEGKAKKVTVAGTFNEWNAEKDKLKEVKPGVFELFLPLAPGRYEYKFVVDGEWKLDPKNPKKILTLDGHENSVIIVKGPAGLEGPKFTKDSVIFTFYAPDAKTVCLCGDFNNWMIGTDCMKKDKKGVWRIEKKLQPGVYKYKFVINETDWIADPLGTPANDEYGNSLIKFVPEGLELGPKIITQNARKITIFTYYAPDAKEVFLCGDFNNWKLGADRMKKDEKGVWSIQKSLPPGEYKYKFVVDGAWYKDPFGVSAGDEYDNSLIVIK